MIVPPPFTERVRVLAPMIGALRYAVSGEDAPSDIRALRDARGASLFAAPGEAIAQFIPAAGALSRLNALADALEAGDPDAPARPRPAMFTVSFPGDTAAL